MKTIQQRLQSRVSKRRNYIREVEGDISIMKCARHTQRLVDPEDRYGYVEDLSETLRDARKLVKELADDQRLDKRIKQVIGEVNATRRFYDFPEVS